MTDRDYFANLNSFVLCYTHNLLANTSEAVRKIKINEMRKLVFMGIDDPRDIVHRVLRGADSELINAKDDFEAIYKFLR
jgi:hypothetical protein